MKKENDKEKGILVCMRVSDMDDPVTGATQTNCVRCDALVWIAPSAKATLIEYEIEIVCNVCGLKSVMESKAKGEPVDLMRITPDQQREIIAHFRKFPPGQNKHNNERKHEYTDGR